MLCEQVKNRIACRLYYTTIYPVTSVWGAQMRGLRKKRERRERGERKTRKSRKKRKRKASKANKS